MVLVRIPVRDLISVDLRDSVKLLLVDPVLGIDLSLDLEPITDLVLVTDLVADLVLVTDLVTDLVFMTNLVSVTDLVLATDLVLVREAFAVPRWVLKAGHILVTIMTLIDLMIAMDMFSLVTTATVIVIVMETVNFCKL